MRARRRARTWLSVTAMLYVCGFAGAVLAAPAYADSVDAAVFLSPRHVPTQSLHVAAGVAAVSVQVASFTATSQAVLDAQRAAAAAAQAAAQAAAAQAAAAAAAAAAVAQSASDSGGSGGGDVAALPASAGGSGGGSQILALAQSFVGVVPYSDGASPAAGFECDGLVQWVYDRFGIEMPRGVSAQAAMGEQIPESQAQPGDLVVYPGLHIGVYDGAGGMVDSPDWGRFVSHQPVWGDPIFVHVPGA